MSSKDRTKQIKSIATKSSSRMLSMRASKGRTTKDMRKEYEDDEDSPKDDEVTESIFKDHAKRLKELRKSGLTDEAYDIEEINAMESLLLDLLPIAEINYRKFPIHTAASAVNHYIATLSSLQADRRALQDLVARSDRITDIFNQSYEDLIRMMITSTHQLQRDIADKGSSKDTGDLFKSFLRSFGKDVTTLKHKNSEKILQMVATPSKK